MLNILLDSGAEVNKAYENGYTLLHLTVFNDHFSFIKVLLDRGADVDKSDYFSTTRLIVIMFHAQTLLFSLYKTNCLTCNSNSNTWTETGVAVHAMDLLVCKLTKHINVYE